MNVVPQKLNKAFSFFTVAITSITSGTIWADSLKTDSVQYDNVYVRTGSRMYIVLIPETGELVNVSKKAVIKNGLAITKSRRARDKIFAEWKKNRGIQDAPSESPVRGPLSADPVKVTPPEEEKKVRLPSLLTNRQDERNKSGNSYRTFQNRNGTQLLTNDPDKFAGNEAYVEVLVDYEAIEIPDQFKRTTSPETPVSVDSLEQVVDYYAKKYRLDKHLIYAVIQAESSGNPYAVSPVGARGLMQLMPGTALEMGVEDIFNPAENIAGGTQYMHKMGAMWNGDKIMILASYNAGPGAVKKYNGVPPYKETENYIRKVLQYERQFKRKGVPTYSIEDIKPVGKSYLPPASDPYYQIVMMNGLTVRAESIQDVDDYYQYTYDGRSARIRKSQVQKVIKPS